MIIISACLCGCNCKYNGENNVNELCIQLLKEEKAALICPEQLGGLTTPRKPAEISLLNKMEKVLTKDLEDVTNSFLKGAEESLNIAKLVNAKVAILKNGSPSCGSSLIYDGTFKNNKIKGEGLTTKLFRKNGIKVYSEDEIDNENIIKIVNQI